MVKIKNLEEILLSKEEQNKLRGGGLGAETASSLLLSESSSLLGGGLGARTTLNPLCRGIVTLSVAKPIGPFPGPSEPDPKPPKCSCSCGLLTPTSANSQMLNYL